MFVGSGKRKCAPPPELVMHNLHAIITLIMIIIIIIPGFFWISCLAPREAGQSPCTFQKERGESSPAWRVTDTLALPVLGAGFDVCSEKHQAIRAHSGPLPGSKIPPFIQQCKSWLGHLHAPFYNGGSWGQRSELSPRAQGWLITDPKRGLGVWSRKAELLGLGRPTIEFPSCILLLVWSWACFLVWKN